MTRPGGRLGMDEWSKGQWQDVLTGRRRWGRDCKRSHGLVKEIDKYSRKSFHWRNKGEHHLIANVITWSNKFRFSILAQVSRGNRSRHWEISEPVSNGHTCDDLWATWYLQCTWTVKNQALSSTSETAVFHAAFPLSVFLFFMHWYFVYVGYLLWNAQVVCIDYCLRINITMNEVFTRLVDFRTLDYCAIYLQRREFESRV